MIACAHAWIVGFPSKRLTASGGICLLCIILLSSVIVLSLIIIVFRRISSWIARIARASPSTTLIPSIIKAGLMISFIIRLCILIFLRLIAPPSSSISTSLIIAFLVFRLIKIFFILIEVSLTSIMLISVALPKSWLFSTLNIIISIFLSLFVGVFSSLRPISLIQISPLIILLEMGLWVWRTPIDLTSLWWMVSLCFKILSECILPIISLRLSCVLSVVRRRPPRLFRWWREWIYIWWLLPPKRACGVGIWPSPSPGVAIIIFRGGVFLILHHLEKQLHLRHNI